MEFYLTKRAKIIIGVVVGALLIAGAIGGSIAIANGVKKNKQKKCNHVYDEGKIKVEATCEDVGVKQYKCSECDYILAEEIPANGHVEITIEAVEAACATKGATDGVKCETCNKVLVAPAETLALGHKPELSAAVLPTCTTAGKTEGIVCSRCDEVIKEQKKVPAKGHTVAELKGTEPTCTEAGMSTGSMCSTCGITYSAQEVIPALGHSDGDGDGYCDFCEEQETVMSGKWRLCTDAADLRVGDKIVIVVSGGTMALGDTQNTNNRSATEIVFKDGGLIVKKGVQVITLEEGYVEGTFALNVGAGYLYASSSSSNQLKTREYIDENSSWEITIDSYHVANIVAQGENEKNVLMYNTANQLFSCYNTAQETVSIYKFIATEEE